MSKTPILTAEAPEGLLSLDPNDPVLAAAGVPEATAEEEAAEEEVTEGEEGEAGEGEEGEAAAAATASDAGFTTMLSTLNSQLIDARVALERVTTERDELRAGNGGLRQIVIEQTQGLRIRLGQPAGSDLNAMPDSTLVATHQAVHGEFMSRFKPGPVSRAPEKEASLPTAVVTRLDHAVRRATSFGNK
jgi:hypothetical protein